MAVVSALDALSITLQSDVDSNCITNDSVCATVQPPVLRATYPRPDEHSPRHAAGSRGAVQRFSRHAISHVRPLIMTGVCVALIDDDLDGRAVTLAVSEIDAVIVAVLLAVLVTVTVPVSEVVRVSVGVAIDVLLSVVDIVVDLVLDVVPETDAVVEAVAVVVEVTAALAEALLVSDLDIDMDADVLGDQLFEDVHDSDDV